jgi:hypothetical protein
VTPEEFNARVRAIDAECDLAVRRIASRYAIFERHPQMVMIVYPGAIKAIYDKRDRAIDALEAEFYGVS